MAFDIGSIIGHLKLETAGFQSSLSGATAQAEGGGMSFGKMAGAVALGQAAFVAAQEAISEVGNVMKDVIGTTEDLGTATLKLTRETGMTSEQASGLIAVFDRFGVDTQGISKDLGLFAKQIVLAGDASKYSGTALGEMGIKVRDARGNLMDTQTVLLEVADKFKAMPDGVLKTDEAMKLFGRSGKDMIPILNEGSDGIKSLEAEAAKMGVVLSKDNVKAIHDNMMATASWKEAITGIELQVGNKVIPVLTNFTKKLTTFVESDKFKGWLKDIGGVLKDVGVFFQLLFEVIRGGDPTLSAGQARFAELARVMSEVGYILNGVVIPVIKSVAETLEGALKKAFNFLMPAIDAVWNSFKNNLMPQLEKLIKEVWPVLGPILKDLATILGVVIVVGLRIAIDILNVLIKVLGGVINAASGLFNGIRQLAHDIASVMSGVYHAIADPFTRAFNDVYNAFHKIEGVGKTLHSLHIPGFATGVQNFAGGLALVGERGPEIVNLPQGASVTPNNQISGMTGKGGVSINVQGDIKMGSDYDVDKFMKRVQRNIELSNKGLATV